MFFRTKAEVTDEEEKTAVEELRKRINDGSQPVEDQLREGGEAGLKPGPDDFTLLRWLRAEDNDVDKAEKRLRSHAIWRQKEFPKGGVQEDEIADEIGAAKVFLQGCDKHGRKVLVLKVNRHLRSKRDLSQTMRLLCYSLDKAISLADKDKNPTGRVVGIFDLRGLTMDSIDNAALRGTFDMLQNHYPERLGTLWMFESPSIFWVLWKAVSPFIDPVTKKKVVFVSEKHGPDELRAEIDNTVLPKDFGGEAELVPISELAHKVQPASNTENPKSGKEHSEAGAGSGATNVPSSTKQENGGAVKSDYNPHNGTGIMGP